MFAKKGRNDCDSKCPADDDKMTTLCENRVYCASHCSFVPSSLKLPTCTEPPTQPPPQTTRPPPLTSRPPAFLTTQLPPPPLTKPPPSNVKPSESEQPQDQP